MDKLIEEQELARIKREQDEIDAQKKEAEEQELTRHIMEDIAQEKLNEQKKQEQSIEIDQFLEKLILIAGQMKEKIVSKTIKDRVKNAMINTVNYTKIGQKESEKKQVTCKLIDLTLVEDGDLCVIDFDINKKLSIEETDKIRQNIIDNMLPANVSSVKTVYGGLNAYYNRDAYALPSNRCVKCVVLENIEIDIFGQMFKYKEHGQMEQKELVQNRVVGSSSSFRETKNNKRETLKYEAVNDWANMTHLASEREILYSWNVDIEILFKEYIDKVNMRDFGWQMTEKGTIDKKNDEIAQACVDGLKNLEIHNYPQPINMEVSLLSVFSGIYGISNEQIRIEGINNIRKFNKLSANAEKNYGQAAFNGEPGNLSKNIPNIDDIVCQFNIAIVNKILTIANEMKNFHESRMSNMDASKSINTQTKKVHVRRKTGEIRILLSDELLLRAEMARMENSPKFQRADRVLVLIKCVIILISAKDADIQFPVDRSEPRVSAIVVVTLNSEKLRQFLITSKQFDEIELLRNNIIQNQNDTLVQSNTCMMITQWMIRQVREILIPYFKDGKKKNSLPATAACTFLTDNASLLCTQVVRDFLYANYILLLKLPPNSTHLLQHCDLRIFGSLKLAFQQEHAEISKLSIEQTAAHIIDATQKSPKLLSIGNIFQARAVTTVVLNGKLVEQFIQESIDTMIKKIQADIVAMPVSLVKPKRRRRLSKFGPLNATPKK
ncbi:MAG: hypothetical protein EZS28_000035 [Streblomastix strix]|uniref:DDE-1 domain-containing protein n=1 Tax=Streblomastix strix TaxID=222440 RepID=A0A5J4XD57_9EUKA|nr:MAG: hypothetical protein EZS28_000035 [Streblomastix strix]